MNLLDQEQNQELNNNKEKKMTDNNMEIGTWTQLAESLYEFLNRRGTTIEYTFADMEVWYLNLPAQMLLRHVGI